MIRWDHTLALLALAVIPLVALFFAWSSRRRWRALDAFVAASLVPAVAPGLDLRRRRVRAGVRTVALLLLVVALAGPMWGFRWEEVHREGIDLVVALDTSRSMLANDVKPNRLARAKLAVRDLIMQLKGDRIALVAFAGTAFVQCPLTLDYAAFTESLDAIDVGIIPKGGTAIAEAIDKSLDAFEGHQGKHQALILITDGEDHEGAITDAIKHATDRGVKVFTVGLGTTEGELIPTASGGFVKDRNGQVVKSRLDEDTLKKIAVDTGGVYMHAGGTTFGLAELYRDYIATMEKRELTSTLERRYEHRFQIPLALAILLLLAEALIGERRVARPRRRSLAALVASMRRNRRAAAPATAASASKLAVIAFVVALTSIAWLDPHATGREANRLYDEGKFDEAIAKYNQALIDQPDSARLHFNLGDAAYKGGKLEDALNAFTQVPTEADGERPAKVAYNVGNAKYRMAAAAEASDPQNAMKLYAEALVAYRRAIGAAPNDPDPKFNYELTVKKLEDLKKKLEEQQKQQQQQQQANDQQQQKQDQQQQQQNQQDQNQQQAEQQKQNQPSGENGEQQQAEKQPSEQQQQEQQAQQEQQKDETKEGHTPEQRAAAGEQPPASQQQAAAAEGEKHEGEMSRQEATALLDAQRDDEVQPEQIIKRLQGPAAVAEPAQDW